MNLGIKKYFFLASLVSGLLLATQCKKDTAYPVITLDEQIIDLRVELQTLPEVVHPEDNPSTTEKVNLGKLLFWDPVVSGEKDVACATCHHPDFGYADGLTLSIGVGGSGLGGARTEEPGSRIPRVGRNSPTIINSAFIGMKDHHEAYSPEEAPMFWDSRSESLESQCLGPPTSYNEMAGDAYAAEDALDSIMLRLAAIPEYVSLFNSAFPTDTTPISSTNYSKAIAAFERTIISTDSPFDQYARGQTDALTKSEKRGLLLFFGKANCANCHRGPMFSDYKLTVHGVNDNADGNFPDTGAEESYKFKTPTLRNIELTAPYTHAGMYATLEDAVNFYNEGVSQNPQVTDDQLDVHVEPINLNDAQISNLISFLKALTDESFDISIPSSVPSGLTPGGNLN